jgi:hypothetical protein
MIQKPTSFHFNAITTGAIALLAALIVLPAPSARAADSVQPVAHPMPSRVAPAGAHASHAARIDPRIAQFNRELAAYKQTVAALRRDTERLMMQEKRLDALVSDINSSAQMDMINLQSLMSNRQTAIQLTTNMLKALNDSEKQIVHNIGK